MRTTTRRLQKFITGLWVVILLFGIAVESQANTKIEDLKQKVADMTLLHHQLADRIEQAKVIREKFRHQKQSLTDEINVLRQANKFKAFEDADQHLRVHYNLLLIGSVDGYLKEIDNKILYFKNGQNRLLYLQKLASDDIRMIGTLNDLEIDALTTQISLVISQYLPEAHVIQLSSNDIAPSPPQHVWKRITSQSN